MRFTRTALEGVVIVELEPRRDDRGYFARTFCEREFEEQGLATRFVQANSSFNVEAGTLRGLHWQAAPHGECKLVRCTRGVAFDVVVDVRDGSPTYRRWVGVELDADSGRAVHVPEGCAHGYLTRAPGTEVQYLVSAAHAPGFERGVRFDDPALRIDWPAIPRVVSDRDRSHPLLEPA